jgi:hypothetical protein
MTEMLVIVTGAEAAAGPVQAALESAGAEVLLTEPGADPSEKLGGRAADAYVQLPTLLSVEVSADGGSLVERIGQFLSDGLLMRFRAAARVLPHLGEQSRVVLVAGNTPVPNTGVDDQAARTSLLRVLAHALRAEEAPQRLRVRVLEHGTDPATIARTATGEGEPRRDTFSAPAGDSDADTSYVNWRTEVLGLASVEF